MIGALRNVYGGVRDLARNIWKGFQLHPEVLLVAALLAGLLAWDAQNKHQDTCAQLEALFRAPAYGPIVSFEHASALVLRYPQIGNAIRSCGFDILSLTS